MSSAPKNPKKRHFGMPLLRALVLTGLFVVLYQHCSSNFTNFQELSLTAQTQTSTEGGNGDGYEGKIYVSQGECESSPTHISSKISLQSKTKQAFILRERCENLMRPQKLDPSEFEILEENFESFRYRGEVFLPESRVGANTEESIVSNSSGSTNDPSNNNIAGSQSEVFSTSSNDACTNGYCTCVTLGQPGTCGATDDIPNKFCVAKGFTRASTWTCSWGPQARICANLEGTSCWTNQNPGNSICASITCVK